MTLSTRLNISRRSFVAGLGMLAIPVLAKSDARAVEVWKTPTCGCCGAWVEHLESSGFSVVVQNMEQDALDTVKARLLVPSMLRSCHTALVGGYVIEGHVPAADIELLLSFAPRVTGLAVPGMPIGSPGMEMGDESEPFETIAFDERGPVGVFARHG